MLKQSTKRALILRGTTIPKPGGGMLFVKPGAVVEVTPADYEILLSQGQAQEHAQEPAKAPPAKLSDSAGNPVTTR